MNYARNCEYLLNFVKVIPKTLLVPFFSGHGVYVYFYVCCLLHFVSMLNSVTAEVLVLASSELM